MSELAAIHRAAGLPRGRGSLDPERVALAHREWLMRAAVSAIAERGFADTRISDIVARAQVSRSSFYALFPDKQACFLAAHQHGLDLILSRLASWGAGETAADPLSQLAGGVAAYVRLATDEPEFARCTLIELQAIGPAGLAARLEAHQRIAAILRLWHEQAARNNPSWPPVAASRYAAAVGAVHDLLFAAIAREHEIPPSLSESALDAIATLLELPTAG